MDDVVLRNRRRAVELWDALAVRFLDARGGVRHGRGGGSTFSWPFGQVLAAALDLDRLSGGPRRSEPLWRGLERYRHGEGYADAVGGHDRYYDDNAWIGLDAVQAHRWWGDPARLAQADRTFAFLREGDHPDGGVFWREHPRESRNACSTLPTAALALRLHLAVPDPDLVAFAQRHVAWTFDVLVGSDGLVADNVDGSGRVEPTRWTYNQGSLVGACVLLAATTDDADWHRRGRSVAAATIARFEGDGWWAQPPAFVAVCFRNLLGLAAAELRAIPVDGPFGRAAGPLPGDLAADGSVAPAIVAELDGYLDRVWDQARDPRTGLCTGGGIAAYDGSPVLDTAGLIQLYALRTFALTDIPAVS